MHCPLRYRRAAVAALACLVALAGSGAADEPAKKVEKTSSATTSSAKKTTTSTSLSSALGGLFAARAGPNKTPAQKEAESKGSHKQTATISVTSSDGKNKLQTLCVDGEGRVLALVAPARHFNSSAKDVTSEVHVFDGDGKKITHWQVDFHAHSINTGPDGTVFVAGDGKVARFDKTGKSLARIELPHIQKLLANKDELRKQAEAQIKQQRESFANIVDQYKKKKEDLEKIPAEKRTALQKRQLTQFDSILKSYAETEKYYASQTVDNVLAGILSRLRIINAIAVSEKDVFITCGESKGYGYAVWRLSHDFKEAKQVLSGLSGCCGQMDVQCCGEDMLVAQNCDHQFGRYTRDGKKIGSWGKRGADTQTDCFGGCCNPMNVRALKNEVYTAESEGLIKRFDDKGKFLGVVGYAPLTGGCKNVAVGVSPDGSKVYFVDLPGSRVIVLERKHAASE